MATQNNIQLPIATTAPGVLPPNLYNSINDLYIALAVLVRQLNDGSPVMMSPNGHYWKAVISNAGVITWTDVGTTRP